MKPISKILTLFLLILLSGNAIGVAIPPGANSTEKAQHSSIGPANSPALFAIHQEKTGMSLLISLFKANSSDYSQNLSFGYLLIEATAQKQAAIYLQLYQATDRSLAIKKLIFPFHAHW
jgi:hypothetical protein